LQNYNRKNNIMATKEDVKNAVRLVRKGIYDAGICIACGAEYYECDSDATELVCEECGSPSVFGIDHILMEEEM
jgi:PHP family Zn ribbon phosphoesterase